MKTIFQKYEQNPIFGGGDLGTCFDVYVSRDNGRYRMDFSWRPKLALAVTFSDDGIHWEEPIITLEPRPESGWEDKLNRNCVIKGDGKYKMWYTGQARGYSFIGFAESEEAFTQNAQAIHDELLECHQLFDIYNDYEGINNLKTVNESAGIVPVEVDRRIIDLLLDCRDYYRATNGRVNVAMGSVLELWHIARNDSIRMPDKAYLPDESALEEAAQHVDFSGVVIDEAASTVFLTDPAMRLDVGAIEYIHKQIVAQRDAGKAVLLVSLELDEVMNVSDRILVMYEGEIVGQLNPKTTTVQELGLYMAGAKRM